MSSFETARTHPGPHRPDASLEPDRLRGPSAGMRGRGRTVAGVGWLALAFAAAAPLAAPRPVDRRFAVRPDVALRVYNLAGSVRIVGWDRDSVTVTGTVTEPARGEGFFLAQAAEGAKLGVWSDVETGKIGPSHLELQVPTGSRVWVRTASATVTVSAVTGGVDISSVTGGIRVTGRPSELYAETLGGDIDVDAETRSVRAKTASGAIRIRGAIREVVATSVSGHLTIEGDRFEHGRFESVDGDIRYYGTIGRGSVLDFVDHSGAVEFLLPAGASADFDVNTFYGGFEDQFGVRATYADSKLKGAQVRFTLGAGGGQVTVRNFRGRVIIRKKG